MSEGSLGAQAQTRAGPSTFRTNPYQRAENVERVIDTDVPCEAWKRIENGAQLRAG